MSPEANLSPGGDEVLTIPLGLLVAVKEHRRRLERQAKVGGGSTDLHPTGQPQAQENDPKEPLAHSAPPEAESTPTP